MKVKLTAYFDRLGKNPLEERITLAKRYGIEEIGFRYYQERPLIEMSEKDIKHVYQLLKDNHMQIAYIDGQVGDFDLNSDSQYKEHLDQFKFMIELADKLRVNIVCLRLPKFTKVIDEFENINIRLTPFFEAASKRRKRIWLMPANDYKANTYAYIFKKMKTSHVDMYFDPVYFLNIKQSNTTAYRLLKRYIGAFACHDQNQYGTPKLLGYGKTDILGLFKRLKRDRYNGHFIVDNAFYDEVFDQTIKKKGLFGLRARKLKKQKETLQKEISHILFPNEETRVCTYDDVLTNQIKLVKVYFS